jgi:hypothetical protein
MYAKVSYRRFGRVDLDGIWHWREIQSDPVSYGMDELIPLPRPEIELGREHIDHPWCHVPGDEWIVANPVEIPGILTVLETCKCSNVAATQTQSPKAKILVLPAELLGHILSFLDLPDLDRVSDTCRKLRSHSNQFFEASIIRDMPWFWELFERNHYPSSPDRPATWDPLLPTGQAPPTLPPDLESEEVEEAIWEQIVADDPEMEKVRELVKEHNRLRREKIFGEYRATQESSLLEWQKFRRSVEEWVCHVPHGAVHDRDNMDWTRMWRLFNPATTKSPGVKNRARIWSHCEHILDSVARARELGEIDSKHEALRAKLSDPSLWGYTPQESNYD